MKLFNLRLGAAIIQSSMILFITTHAHGDLLAWPTNGLESLSLLEAIGPGRNTGIGSTYGIESPWSNKEWTQLVDLKKNKRSLFQTLNLAPEWNEERSCLLSARPHGYIHTETFHLNEQETLEIALPVRLKLKGRYENKRIAQIRGWPIIKLAMIVHKPDGSMELPPHSNQYFTIRDLEESNLNAEKSFSTDTDLAINFKSLIITHPISTSTNTLLSIRIEWAADTICDENTFSLKLGDQLRVYRTLSRGTASKKEKIKYPRPLHWES